MRATAWPNPGWTDRRKESARNLVYERIHGHHGAWHGEYLMLQIYGQILDMSTISSQPAHTGRAA